jgi:hypothetical protein
MCQATRADDFSAFRGVVMPRPITQVSSSMAALKRALAMWPYVFIAASVAGFAYIAWNAAH